MRLKRQKTAPATPNAIEVAFSRVSAVNRADAERQLAFESWIDGSVCPAINILLGRVAVDALITKADNIKIKKLNDSIGADISRCGLGVLAYSHYYGLGTALAARYEPEGYRVQFSDPVEWTPDQRMTVLIGLPDISPYIREAESHSGQLEG